MDPELTASLPPEVVASCGLDVICHAAESFVAKPYSERERPESPGDRPPYQGSTPISDIWSAKALEYGGRYLRDAVGGDEEARGWMMLAASLAGHRVRGRRRAHPARLRVSDRGVEARLPAAGLSGRPRLHPARPVGHRHRPGRVPLHLRGGARPPPPRRRAAGRRAAARTPARTRCRTCCSSSCATSARRPGIRELGYDVGDVDALVEGALKQQRLLVVAPREADGEALGAILRASL